MEGDEEWGRIQAYIQRHEMQPHKIGARKSFRIDIDIEHLWGQKKEKSSFQRT